MSSSIKMMKQYLKVNSKKMFLLNRKATTKPERLKLLEMLAEEEELLNLIKSTKKQVPHLSPARVKMEEQLVALLKERNAARDELSDMSGGKDQRRLHMSQSTLDVIREQKQELAGLSSS